MEAVLVSVEDEKRDGNSQSELAKVEYNNNAYRVVWVESGGEEQV